MVASQFENVLKKIILPQFPEVNDVWVSQFGLTGDYIRVRYILNHKWESSARQFELQEETVSLYKMMSPSMDGDIFIEMRLLEDEEDENDDY